MSECKACGNCCKYITIIPRISHLDVADWLSFHGVELKVKDTPLGPVEVLRFPIACKKLTEDGKCSVYENRPQICKGFPIGFVPECPNYKEEGK